MSHNVRPISAEETSAPILLMTSITISVWTSRRVGLIFVHLVRLVTLERKKIVNPTVTTGTFRTAPVRTLRLAVVVSTTSVPTSNRARTAWTTVLVNVGPRVQS